MKILWVSDSIQTISAYAGQTKLFVPRLKKAGHEVALLPFGCPGSTYRTLDGIQVYPTWVDPRGNDVVEAHAKDFHADVVVTLCDPHVLSPASYGRVPWLAWAPLDFECPTRAMLRSLSAARWIWSPSRAGWTAYNHILWMSSKLKTKHVPHSVDSKLFSIGEKKEARIALQNTLGINMADYFVMSAVAANQSTPSRKGFFELFSAMKMFSDRHADARLYVHTDPVGIAGGENLYDIMDLVDLKRHHVWFPPEYAYRCGEYGPDVLANVYRASDVYLSTSHGEGFGLGAIESQLCGTPVIVSRNTAQTELCLTGHAVRTESYMPFDGATLWRRPVVSAIVEALESVYDRRHETPNREAIRDRVMRYDVGHVFEREMLPALKEIEAEVCR